MPLPWVSLKNLKTGGAGTLASPYTGWDAALAAALTNGLMVFVDGWYQAASNIVLDQLTSVHFFGRDGHLEQSGGFNTPAVGAPTCGIVFTGNGPNISMRDTIGCTLEGFQVRNLNTTTFTSALVDASGTYGVDASNVTLGLTLRNMTLNAAGGTGSGNPDCCLLLDNTVETYCDNVVFYGAKYGIVGVRNATYATAVEIRGGRFHSQTQVPILNPHIQWTLNGVVFEPMPGGLGKWVLSNYGGQGAQVDNLTLIGCYQWDNAGGGNVLDLQIASYNVTMTGCHTNSVGGVVVSVPGGVTCHGLTLTGNSFQNNSFGAGNGTLLRSATPGTIQDAHIAGNIYGTGIDNLEAAVSSGQIASGNVVDSNGNHLLPSRCVVGEQRSLRIDAVPHAVNAAKWDVSDAGTSGGSSINITNSGGPGPADADYIQFAIWLPAGTYTWDFSSRQSPDQAKVQPSLDGVSQGGLLDLYLAVGQFTSWRVTGIVIAASGRHLFRLTVTGKNASSSNYYARLGNVWTLTRTA